MNIPLISIIVPCYNVEQYLPQCIESILSQTSPNWELLLVNDGSTDNTLNICKQYAKKDSRIVVINKANGGLVSARNAGYEAITGSWHMYVDGDDWIDINTCKILTEKIQQYQNLDIIFWKFLQDLNGKPIKGKLEWKCPKVEQLYNNEECKNLAMHTLIYSSGISSPVIRLIKTDYAKKNNICHDPRLRQGAEGIEFALKSFYYAHNALYINQYLYNYRYNPNSISKKADENNTKYIIDCFNILKEKIDCFPERNKFLPFLYQRIIYSLIAIAMSTYFFPGGNESLYYKCKRFHKLICETTIFKEAIKQCNTKGIDKLRKTTFYIIKYKLYGLLAIISSLKQYFLKKGKFNY